MKNTALQKQPLHFVKHQLVFNFTRGLAQRTFWLTKVKAEGHCESLYFKRIRKL